MRQISLGTNQSCRLRVQIQIHSTALQALLLEKYEFLIIHEICMPILSMLSCLLTLFYIK
jgi:hypothetical protein